MPNALYRFMRSPGIFVRIFIISLVVGILGYVRYGTLSSALWYAIACFVLMQVGYFGGILYLVWKQTRNRH
jgi:uncharacterized membrane protein YqaE (UPF0057 family)